MTVETSVGVPLSPVALEQYLANLVNLFFKILPMREKEEESLVAYMRSLQLELIGFDGLILSIRHDPYFITLLSILQYFIDNPEADVQSVRSEVFRAITICGKLRNKYVTEVS